ncbi:MAG: hypothetical protein NTX82_00715 [Candidatus Parcubacteria bacterium]|nr:hypothetical protein [Candidatus Parcubacteria bacterium]
MEKPRETLSLEALEAQITKPLKLAEREKAALSMSALAAREIYEMSQKSNISDVTEKEVERLLGNLEMSNMEFLATLQAEVKNLYGKELKPVVIPQMYKVILRAWSTIKQAEKDTSVNKAELQKKTEFFLSLYHLITTDPSYKRHIPDLANFEQLN